MAPAYWSLSFLAMLARVGHKRMQVNSNVVNTKNRPLSTPFGCDFGRFSGGEKAVNNFSINLKKNC
jgi:hypothetical protein